MITRRVTVLIVIVVIALSSAVLVAYDVSYPGYVTSTYNSTMDIGSNIKGQNITTIGRWKYSIFCCLAFSVSKDNSNIAFDYSANSGTNSFAYATWPTVLFLNSNGIAVYNYTGAKKATSTYFNLDSGSCKVALAVILNFYPGYGNYAASFLLYVQVKSPEYLFPI
ncbi:MAG: hypothetical protein ACYCQJ_08200 [Nitrososphaerales archaeon]